MKRNSHLVSAGVVYALCATVSQQAYSANNLEIISGSVQNITGNSYITAGDNAQLGVDDILNAWSIYNVLNISTGESGLNSQSGNITFNADLDNSGVTPSGSAQQLRLKAHNNIILNSTFSYLAPPNPASPNGGTSYLSLTPDSDGLNGGRVYLNGTINGYVDTGVAGDLTIGSTGSYTADNGGLFVSGSITIDGASATLMQSGGSISAGSISFINGGSFGFNSGSLALTSSGLTVGAGGLLGNTVSLDNTKNLSLLNNNILTIDSGASMTVDGGSLSAGSINNAGTFAFNSGSLSLTNSGLTVGSGGLLGSSVVLDNTKSLSVSDALTIGATGNVDINGGDLSVGAIDNSAGGSFNFNSGSLSLTNSGLTIGSGGLLGSNVVLNNSRQLSRISGGVTVENGATLTLNSGAVAISGSLSNNGTISVTKGSFYSEGGVVNDGAGANITVSGNPFRNWEPIRTGYFGTTIINNTNGASITLDGGSLQATSITNTNGATFTFNSGALSLDDLTIGNAGPLGNNFTLSNLQTLLVSLGGVNDLNIDAGANFTVDGGTLQVNDIANAGVFTFNSGEVIVQGASGVTIGVGGMFGNTLSLGNNSVLSVTNPYSYNPTLFAVDAGASFSLDGGELRLRDADISVAGAGSFSFNSGRLWLRGSTTALTVGNNGLLGNSVTFGSGKELISESTIVIDSGASLTVNGGYFGASAGISNAGSFSFNSGILSLGGGLNIGGGGLLGSNVALSSSRQLFASNGVTIETGANVSVNSGQSGLYGGVTNNGIINVSGGELRTDQVINNNRVNIASGASLGSSAFNASFVQDAGRTTVNGTLTATSVVINDGRLDGAGVIEGDVSILGGTFGPGNSSGAMEVTGNFVLTAAGTLQLEVGSDGLNPAGYLWDQLIVGGEYDLQGGLVKFSLLDGIDIMTLESEFTISDFFRNGTKGLDTGFDLLQLAMFDSLDLFAYDVLADNWYSLTLDGTTGGFNAVASTSPVPVPAAVWLFASGLIGLIGFSRRKV